MTPGGGPRCPAQRARRGRASVPCGAVGEPWLLREVRPGAAGTGDLGPRGGRWRAGVSAGLHLSAAGHPPRPRGSGAQGPGRGVGQQEFVLSRSRASARAAAARGSAGQPASHCGCLPRGVLRDGQFGGPKLRLPRRVGSGWEPNSDRPGEGPGRRCGAGDVSPSGRQDRFLSWPGSPRLLSPLRLLP